ncbi:MAG: Imidazoleglycerol-phosphate dehydratase [Thermocaproicibacter melissae]|jgi:imidazoleglycerol-phosphate dehydratase|uniref:imidazoleglycerol-phosphate dehydratase HisB n=1 Tax=Thermocaproicibacter melissae TaxID=2966552 RepID=UPI0024B1E2EA|nr:imidazoleglycerol-phosphate dehydratase HisB [Thermocaproicibacter melissae]WBY64836.1 imidazoleglycerol-phosphate dehydratase HisB [Thermocaproicibacter melissae]
MRTSVQKRTTRETDVSVSLNLDGGESSISTGIGFFDHMLNSFAVHGGFGLTVKAVGDLNVDCHHTIEDTGIVLGKAFAEALGDRSGIARFGSSYVPMDESLAFTAVDISGRPFLVFHADFAQDRIGEYDTCMTEEFFRAFAFQAGFTMHARVEYGTNAHHQTEALFKSAARAIRSAVTISGGGVLSTKGIL